MDGGKTITTINDSTPSTTSTVDEEHAAATMAHIRTYTTPPSRHDSEDQDGDSPTTPYFDFEKPGSGTLFFCLVLNMLVTTSWYYINIDVPVSRHLTSGLLCRYLYDSLFLLPMGLFSLFECLYCFSALLCLRQEDRALCIARVALGGMLGASVVVKYGLGAGIFDGGAWVQLCFWAATGVLPGAGAVALVGFCWDCLYWGWEKEDKWVVDEKRPLLEKEDV